LAISIKVSSEKDNEPTIKRHIMRVDYFLLKAKRDTSYCNSIDYGKIEIKLNMAIHQVHISSEAYSKFCFYLKLVKLIFNIK